VVAIALVLVAVFLPTAFITGISGQFYRQFAVTISVATLISAFVSLSLSPALAALLLRPKHGRRVPLLLRPFAWFSRGFNAGFNGLARFYGGATRRLVRMGALLMLVYLGLLGLTAWRFAATPQGFIPQQDRGYLIVAVQLPPGAALARTDAVIHNAVTDLRTVPGVAHAVGIVGFSGATFTSAPNAGAIFLTLEDYTKRAEQGLTIDRILAGARQKAASISEGMVLVIQPPPVAGIGNAGGFKLMVEDRAGRGVDFLLQATFGLMMAANQQPGLRQVFTLFETSTPQIYADIDRTKAQMLGVPLANVFDAMSVYLGSAYVNDFNFLGRTYRVTAQADVPYRLDPQDIANLRTRNSAGEMVPIGSVSSFKDRTGPYRVPRYNLYTAAELQGDTAPGFSSGQAIQTMEALAARVLPEGAGLEWTELAYQQKLAGNTGMIAFAGAVVCVFLLLAALYESWTLPLAVILIVPMCLLSAILGVNWRGMDNNILTQIGLVVLVGLAAKNAILIVEFARQAEEEGHSRFEAAAIAARTRLRPILMTSFAFIFGVVPLVIATGAGAEMRQALGTAVFYGMIGVTFFGLVFTPVFYVLARRIARRRAAAPAPEPRAAAVPSPAAE
jgi:HAE1 family hydrophobic/amphiphilic exporter-1